MNDKDFGKIVIINGQVVCNEEDEDLRLYIQCCDSVCKLYKEILDEEKTSN
jgi:hypothetical protein